MNANSVATFVGLDYAENVVQVVVVDPAGQILGARRCPNDQAAIVGYGQRFGPVAGAAIEACCGAAALTDVLVQEYGWAVQMAHPGFVQRMKRNPDKTDYSDAHVLADLRRVGYVPQVWLAPPAVRELRRLVRYRQSLVDQGRAIKLRVRALLREHRLKVPAEIQRVWTRRGRTWLAHLSQAETVLPETSRWILTQHLGDLAFGAARQAASAARLRRVVEPDSLVLKLLEQPGVGLVTACVLRAEIGSFERFRTGKQLAHFCGLSPQNVSSGERQADAGLVRGGNPLLKATLVELAHRLAVCVPQWKAFRARLLAAGKPRCVIAAAIANRWVRKLYYAMSAAEAASPAA